MRKWLLVPLFGLSTLTIQPNLTSSQRYVVYKSPEVAYNQSPTPTIITQTYEVPAHLSIPAIKLESAIVPVTLTEKKIVDVPDSQVGWYQNGVKPGERGNAVLDGHYNDPLFRPGIFHNLSQLAVGEDIFVTDQKSQVQHFKVTKLETINVRDFPVQTVYGYTDRLGLNLITCAGRYDKNLGTYTHRTIVYSEKIEN